MNKIAREAMTERNLSVGIIGSKLGITGAKVAAILNDGHSHKGYAHRQAVATELGLEPEDIWGPDWNVTQHSRNKKCSLDGCNRPHKAKGLCELHYRRRKSDIAPDKPLKGYGKKCTLEGCNREFFAKGLCRIHYGRKQQGIRLDKPIPECAKVEKLCAHEGCNRPARTRLYCSLHHTRNERGLPMDDPLRYSTPVKECTVEGCSKRVWSQGYCNPCHKKRAKELLNQTDVKDWVLGKEHHTRQDGYVMVNVVLAGNMKASILEHHYVMAKHIGRPLTPTENVHHLNGTRDDNRIENLELWDKSQPAGQRVADRVEWAVGLLNRYGEEFGYVVTKKAETRIPASAF